MIRKLLDALHSLELNLTTEEIADTLWLASYIDQKNVDIGSMNQEEVKQPEEAKDISSIPNNTQQHNERKMPPSPASEDIGSGVFLPSSHQGNKTLSGIAFKSPAASALPGALHIARSLRPLMRKLPSNIQFFLDEDATAQQIAEQNIWLPVIRPTMTQWLDVALVIDESASMVIWKQTITELRSLLEYHGAFRYVRTWGLITDADDGKASIVAGRGSRQKRSPRELLAPNRHRLILIVSDCIALSWHNGEVIRLLTTWGEKTPVVIMQVLPQRLWSRTALGTMAVVRLHASAAGVPNTQLTARSMMDTWLKQKSREGLPMPVVTLEARGIAAWARMVAGTEEKGVPGFLLKRSSSVEQEAYAQGIVDLQREEHNDALSSEGRLHHFQTTASPLARKLAQLLAASPISLPVIRLIQRTMLPEARQEHIAEVFLGGLLEEIPSESIAAHPDEVQYEFIGEIRDLLLNSISISDSIQVLKEVSDFVGSRFGQSFDFSALLANPNEATEISLNEQSRPFASLASRVLRRLGGKYALIAENLERTINKPSEGTLQATIQLEDELSLEEPETQKKSAKPSRSRSIFNSPRSGLYIMRRCPSCITTFYPGDCQIVSNVQGTVLKMPPSGGIGRQLARINPEPLTGPFYTQEMARRQCPICGYRLPYNIERVNNITIAIIGDTSSGKSHYLAALINQIQQKPHIFTGNTSQFRFTSLTSEIASRFSKEYFEPLFLQKEALMPTMPAIHTTTDPLIYELITRSSRDRPLKHINLILYDTSGEDYVQQQRLVQYSRYVLNAHAIIFLADPLSMPAIIDRLPPHLSLSTTKNSSTNALNSIMAMVSRYKGNSSSVSVPIAITLSKSDLLKYLVPLSGQYNFMLPHEYNGGGINLHDLERVNKEVRDFLERFGDRSLLQAASSFQYAHFFAVSATGYPPDAAGHYPAVEPQRCLDPFLWCLYQLGIISEQK